MDNNIIKDFESSDLVDQGFQINMDGDNNLSFVKDADDRVLSIGVPYSRNEERFFSATSSISFKELQRLYVDLCYSAILRDKEKKQPNKKWFKEQYENATIHSDRKMESPDGVLNSSFKGYSLAEYFDDISIKEINSSNTYKDYLNSYYEHSAKSFFSSVIDLKSLDILTDNLDNYNLGLYLTGIPPLKKIVLMHIVNNPGKAEKIEMYRTQLSSLPSNKTIDALLHSLESIDTYFLQKERTV